MSSDDNSPIFSIKFPNINGSFEPKAVKNDG